MKVLKVRGSRGNTLSIDPDDVAYISAAAGGRRTKIVFKAGQSEQPMEFEAAEDISSISLRLAEILTPRG